MVKINVLNVLMVILDQVILVLYVIKQNALHVRVNKILVLKLVIQAVINVMDKINVLVLFKMVIL